MRSPGRILWGPFRAPWARSSHDKHQPELWVDRAAAAVAFYQAAFGATVLHLAGEGEDVVAQLAVDDAAFWVASTGSTSGRFSPRSIGGATSRMLLVVDEHGWRLGRIVDPFGHEWEIGRPVGAWPPA